MFGSLVPWSEGWLFPTTERSNPWTRMEEMEEMMKRFFPPAKREMFPLEFVPRINVAETEKEFEVTAELPGMKPGEVHVELRNGGLWLTGEHKEEKEEKGKTYRRVERRYGKFNRFVELPEAVEEGKIEAKFENGVLKVTAPKLETAKPKHIEVKVTAT